MIAQTGSKREKRKEGERKWKGRHKVDLYEGLRRMGVRDPKHTI